MHGRHWPPRLGLRRMRGSSQLGNIMADEHKPGAATMLYERCIRLDPRHSRAMNNLGNLLFADNHHSAAIAWFVRPRRLA
jgi:Tfp pilus assembly protein PilF